MGSGAALPEKLRAAARRYSHPPRQPNRRKRTHSWIKLGGKVISAELAAATGTKADPASLSRWLIRNGYRFKKTLLASELDRPRHQSGARRMATTRQPCMRLEPHRLVFIDETGTTTKLTRLRGRCLKGRRLRAKAPFGHWMDPDLRRRPALR
jgi:hypothetical protein